MYFLCVKEMGHSSSYGKKNIFRLEKNWMSPTNWPTGHGETTDGFGWHEVFKSQKSWWWFQISYFHPYLGKISILTNIFQVGWNHQLEMNGWFTWKWCYDASHKGSIFSSSGFSPHLSWAAALFFARDKMDCLWLQKDHHSTNILV